MTVREVFRTGASLSAILSLGLALLAPLSPAAAQSGLPQIEISKNLDPDSIELYADKIDAYARLLAGTSRTVTNMFRYMKSFDIKTGPKGTETSSYDLVGLDGDRYADLIRKAREAAAEKPAIPELDKWALAYADAVSTNAEVFNEAAEYYSSARPYELDKYEHGKTLHPKIVKEIDKYFGTLPPFMGHLHQVRAQLDPQELAIVEKAGRAPARVLARKLTTIGRQASLFVPIGPGKEIDTKGFDAAINAYAAQMKAYNDYRKNAGQRDASLTSLSDSRVEGLFRELRDIRSAYNVRRQVPLQYELLILPFYEHYGRFWSEMLEIVERNPWTAARAVDPPDAAPPRLSPPAPQVAVPDLDRRTLDQWTAKNEKAQQLLVETNALISAWNSYSEWVDAKRGPTGKERSAGSFASIDRGRFVNAIGAARALAASKPAIEAIDTLLSRYADGMEKALPVAVEASGYYQRKDFLSDQMEGGKALHPRLMEDYRLFLETRADLSRNVRSLRDDIERQRLASIEKGEGKGPRWHRQNILLAARTLHAGIPRTANPSAETLKAFDAQVSQFVETVKALEASGDNSSAQFVKEANQYIGKLRLLRREYGTPVFSLNSSMLSLNIGLDMMAQAANGAR